MSDISKSLHSLIFNEEKNTWDDWHLVPTSRPSFAFPEVKTYEQDIPGANGKIDMTDSLTGYPSYKNRSGSIEFLVMHQGLDTSLGDAYGYLNTNTVGWAGVKAEIANYLHGQRMKMEFEDETDWYYMGRFSLDEWKSDETYSTITIKYDLEPFKYSVSSTLDMWKWDPFNFKTGIIHTYDQNNIKITSSGTAYTIVGTVTPIVPTIFVTSSCTLKTPKGTFNLTAGSNKNPLIIVYPGEQVWTFIGNSGSAAIYYRERSF